MSNRYERVGPRLPTRTIAIIVVAIIVIGILVGVATSTVITADTSNIAILVNPFDRTVTDGPIGPAIVYFGKAPWVEVHQVPLSTQAVLMADVPQTAEVKPKTPDVVVLSKDGLTISVELNVRYNVQASKASELFKKYPKLDHEQQIINIVREAVRNVVVQFEAVELIEKRQQLDAPMRDAITSKITTDSTLVGAINVSGIEILKIDPPQSFKDAIAAKLSAQQQAQAALFTRNQTLTNADASAKAAVRQAEGQRDAAIITAQGQAQAVRIQANATRDAVNTVVQSLGGNHEEAARLYIQLQTLQKISENGRSVFIITKDQQGNFVLIPVDNAP